MMLPVCCKTAIFIAVHIDHGQIVGDNCGCTVNGELHG